MQVIQDYGQTYYGHTYWPHLLRLDLLRLDLLRLDLLRLEDFLRLGAGLQGAYHVQVIQDYGATFDSGTATHALVLHRRAAPSRALVFGAPTACSA